MSPINSALDLPAPPVREPGRGSTFPIPHPSVPLVRSAFDLHGGHPSAPVRQSLAFQLGMSPKSVQVWFQNRRQKLRAIQPQSAGTRAVADALLGGSQVPMHNLLSASPDPPVGTATSAANPKLETPATSSARPLSAEVVLSPASNDACISSELSPALLASLKALHGKGSVPTMEALRSRATLAFIPRHLMTELARLTSAENELVLLASHLSKRKAQLVTSIAVHAAKVGQQKLTGQPPDVAPMEDEEDDPQTLPHPSPPPGSSSPPYSSHPPSPEEPPPPPAHAQFDAESPVLGSLSWPSHQPDHALEAGAACAAAAVLSGLHLLSCMATHAPAAAPMAISAA
jgi:hypothetical protein